ncbi:MAG: hypothetical protein ACRC62_12390 [Microcoleus sp.]
MLLSRFSVIVSLIILIFWCSAALPATASVCRNYDSKQICIVDIKRSAKNHWEYRAIISIDGVKQPRETYNCRSRSKIKKDGTVLPFSENDAGKLICSFFKQK